MTGLCECFWSKVQGGDIDQCWTWCGRLNRNGYGRYNRGLAHRLSYQALIGPIPDGLQLDHLCHNRECVNPWDLDPVTNEVNCARRLRQNQYEGRTECPQGHAYNGANTYTDARGFRNCRACARERARARYQNDTDFRTKDKARSRAYQRRLAATRAEQTSSTSIQENRRRSAS